LANRPAANRKAGAKGDQPDPGPVGTLVDLQREKLAIENQRRMLDLLKERGELVPLAAANAHFSGMIVKARNELLLLPSRLRDQLGASDGFACEVLLDAELRHILTGLSTYRAPARPEERSDGTQQPAETEVPK
jgi:hypothetical protein